MAKTEIESLDLSTAEKINLITDRLQEIIGLDELKAIINMRPLKIYFGTAPTGRIHIGYLVPLLKIVDFLVAGCEVKILFADLHARLDSLKTTPELIELRCTYYERMIKTVLAALHIPLDKLIFVRGTSFQLTPQYTFDMYKLTTLVSVHDALKAGSRVVKQSEFPKLSGPLYPLLQILDEEYLGVDIQISGIDQKKITTLARDTLPLLGYKKRIELMTPMLTAINAKPKTLDAKEESDIDQKMSSSDLNSKIDFLDTKNEIKRKINQAYCLEGDLTFNPLMELMKLVIFPLLKHLGKPNFIINRPEKYGGAITYTNFEQLKIDFAEKKLHPQDLKMGIADCLNNFFEPIRQEFSTQEMVYLLKKDYP